MESGKQNTPKKIVLKGDDLNKKNIIYYGLGHVLNDMTSTIWFNFYLYYLTDILQIQTHKAGFIFLLGQIADGISTPLIGIFSDKTNSRFGKKTPWYVLGIIISSLSFYMMFQEYIDINNFDTFSLRNLIFYTMPCIFNFGWACVQVSHMSLLPSITINKKSQDLMVRLRIGFGYIAQVFIIFISILIFYLVRNKNIQYLVLSLISIILGLILSTLFIVNVKEVELSKNIQIYHENIIKTMGNINDFEINKNETRELHYFYWFKKIELYVYLFIYIMIRLSVNISSSVLPYYLDYILGYHKTNENSTSFEISIVICISMLGSIISSLLVQNLLLNSQNRFNSFCWGTFLVFIGSFPLIFLGFATRNYIFILVFINGIGLSIGLSTVSCIINDFIGGKGNESAVVFGAFSFFDKISSGIVLYFFITNIIKDEKLLNIISSVFPCLCMIIALIVYLIFHKFNFLSNKESENKNDLIDNSRYSFESIN